MEFRDCLVNAFIINLASDGVRLMGSEGMPAFGGMAFRAVTRSWMSYPAGSPVATPTVVVDVPAAVQVKPLKYSRT